MMNAIVAPSDTSYEGQIMILFFILINSYFFHIKYLFLTLIVNTFLFKIIGDYEPNDDECEWPSDEEDDELAGDMKVN